LADHIFYRFRSNHEEHEGNAEQGERVVFFFSPLRALQALHGEISFFVSWPRSDGEWSKSVFPDESAHIGVDPCKPSHWSIRDRSLKLTPNPTPICRHLHFAYYNLCRIHETLGMTPAMAANITDPIWEPIELVLNMERFNPR